MPFVTVNGTRLWYEVRGEGEPILLHHGFTATRFNWMPVAERLQSSYQVILMECRGTGESEHTDDGYTLEQYAADVIGVVDHLGIGRFTYAGHSMGGGIGYVLATTYPDRLERLILMAPIPSDGIPGDALATGLPTAKDHDAMLARYRALRIRPEVETDELFEERIRTILALSKGHYEGGNTAMRNIRLAGRLGDIKTPTLMLAGAADSLLPANLQDYLRLPNATLHVFSRTGHEIAIQQPDGTAGVIDDFMKHGVVNARTQQQKLVAAGLVPRR